VSWGVVVGRFQVAELTRGHMQILSEASRDNDDRLLVVLGELPSQPNRKHPLPFYVRAAMIREAFPTAIILPLEDCRSNAEWVGRLDALIGSTLARQPVALYYGRDSFWEAYRTTGAFKGCGVHVTGGNDRSGTMQRLYLAREHRVSEDFRAGMIHAVYNRFPSVFQTVDVAVVSAGDILLGQKPGDDGLWRLPGGFVDVSDQSIEAAAVRELREETGIELEDLSRFFYVMSSRINDWRVRGSENVAMTSLFLYEPEIEPTVNASDDLEQVRWFSLKLDDVLPKVVAEHRSLVEHIQKVCMKPLKTGQV
jgi:bifunctional NMN adenylyltransferase/nudix hydrolase